MTEPEPPAHAARPSLHGRQDVVDAIAGLAAGAAAGQGGALTVVGESGIGKTAVLDEAADLVLADQPDSRILRLRGVEAEVELAWSGLAELLDGVLDGVARLAPARASAVRAALALEGTEQPVEPFAIALATRDLLVDAAEAAPIIVLVDDLHWVDAPTRRTLSYIARRLQFERLAIVSTRRAGADSRTDTGPVVVLDAVPDDVADAILRDAGVTATNVRRELVAASGGVPLVLREAAHMLDADQRSGRAELPDPLPIGSSGQRVVDMLLERLPPAVLGALLVAAAEPDGDLVRIINALREQNLGVAELEIAEEHGVVVLDRDRLTFRHPLMRSAAYHDSPRADRRAAHRALARTLPTGSPARAWHLARAAVGPDEAVAQALEDAAIVTNRHRASAARGRGSSPADSRPSPPTGSGGCDSPPWRCWTPGWRPPPDACSTGPTPSLPNTRTPTTSSSASAASSCAVASHRRRAARPNPSHCSGPPPRRSTVSSRTSPSTCCSTPSRPTSTTARSPTWPTPSRSR